MVSSQITFMMSACLPNRKLCTPESAVVERREAGYHVTSPSNLQWDARVPTPLGRRVIVKDAHGIVCQHSTVHAPGACSGPVGNGTSAGLGFLDPNAQAGALIMKTDGGQTRFSVNSHLANRVKDNEGFYEFDLEFQ